MVNDCTNDGLSKPQSTVGQSMLLHSKYMAGALVS